jgi:hypothetical protein
MRDLLDVVLLERLAFEEVDGRDIGLVRPVDREQQVVDAERHDCAEEGWRRKIAAAGDHKILRQVLRRRSFEAATPGGGNYRLSLVDCAILGLSPPRYVGLHDPLLGPVAAAGSACLRHLIVGGHVVVDNGVIQGSISKRCGAARRAS